MSGKKAQPQKRGRMHGPMGNMMPGEKAKDFKGSVRRLIEYMGHYKWAILVVWILAAASAVFMIFGPKILGNATDELTEGMMRVIAGDPEGINFTAIGKIMLWLVGLYAVSALLSYIQGFIMSGVSMKLTYRLRQDISDKIHRLPLGFYDKTTHGEVLSRITNDVDSIGQSLSQSLTQIITSVTSVVGVLIMMFSISWKLSLVALAILPVSFLFFGFIVKKSHKHFTAQQEYLGHVNGHVEEMYGSHIVVKAFNGEKASEEAFDTYNNTLYNSAWKSNFLSGMMMPVSMFIGNLGYVAVCILGGYFAVNGALTIGNIQSFIQYMRSFMQPISQVANISNVLQQTAASAERVFDFLAQPEEIPEIENALFVNHDPETQDTDTLITADGSVSFGNVSFGYDPEKLIIKDFTAQIKPGQKVAIVGPTGAGKTTIVKLLMRFYDVNSGGIFVGDHNINDFKRDELRSLFGMVLQDTWLFSGSISDNIRYGRLDATEEEIHAAAKAAQVDHFVRTLPDGYQMQLNEEASNVSQGQKQLLTIARAILADPDILILDEATSSVDTRTEILIQKAMDNLMHGRTSFVIAHRLSTIRNADLILVMKDGDIVEQGTHEGLLAQDGFYASLYNSQFEQVAG